ncbi:hypothetical protein PM082_007069 [Marasmius tenuissimus]|nr:hypothetical protein PM082_007069 [Marasmius tenuissimus]
MSIVYPAKGSSSQSHLCPFFLKGQCRFGEGCLKSHGSNTGAVNPQTNEASSLSGTRSGQISRFPWTPTKPCVYWAQGRCTKGESCSFRHDAAMQTKEPRANERPAGEKLTASITKSPPQPRRDSHFPGWAPTQPCVYWAKGNCLRGDSCTFLHGAPTREAEPRSPAVVCVYWAQGRCMRGDSCTFRHDATVGEVESQQPQQAEVEEPTDTHLILPSNQHARFSGIPQPDCIYWARGRCDKGDSCTFRHDPAVKDALDREAETRRNTAGKEGLMEDSSEAEALRPEGERTIRHLALGTTVVKFGAGLNVERVVTGFDACRVRITNLPLSAKYHDVCNLLREQEMEEEMYHLQIDMRSNSKEANIIVEAGRASELALGLNNTDFRGQSLTAEASENGAVGGMDSLNGGTLVVCWWLPSKRYVATYLSPEVAATKLSLHHSRVLNGRMIRVEGDRRNQDRERGVFDNGCTALFISGVPLNVSERKIDQLFDPYSLNEISTLEYNEDDVEELLKGHVNDIMDGDDVDFGGSVDFEPSRLNAAQGNRSIRMKFSHWEDAKVVHDRLKDKKFYYIDDSKFLLWLSDPYQITIPMQQYRAQKRLWDSLAEDTKGRKDGILHLRVFDNKASLRVGGNDTKVVGMLKVRVERLVAGEVLQKTWNAWFSTAEGQGFLESVSRTTGTYIRHDWKLKVLKGYGDPAAITRARALMEEEIERLSRSEYTQTLKPESVRFFLREGLPELRKAFGRASVTLDISSSVRITIRGGEDARQHLRNLIDKSLSNIEPNASSDSESSCPICFTDVDTPVKLGCRHEYCTACLRHFFTADIKNFPILCIGDEAKCGKPIALPVIQKYLESDSEFNALLETAFTTYIEQNQQTFTYCKTPDCKQIYPSGSSEGARRCPSCLASVCTKCHEEGHDGMTCEERRNQIDPAEQDRLNSEWAKGAGVKRCPKCQVWIEKTEGCNHMSCKCGAHICWVCMGTFEAQTIYGHMSRAHGGCFDTDIAEEPAVGGGNPPARIEALAVFENRERERTPPVRPILSYVPARRGGNVHRAPGRRLNRV